MKINNGCDAEWLIKTMKEEYGIETMEQLKAAIAKLPPLDITIFCGDYSKTSKRNDKEQTLKEPDRIEESSEADEPEEVFEQRKTEIEVPTDDQNDEFDFSLFRDRLKRLIVVSGKTLTAFAKSVDIPAATISRYLSGAREPQFKYVVKIANHFDVSVDWLLGLNNDKDFCELHEDKMSGEGK